MEKVDISIKGNTKDEFFVKALDFDECLEFHEKTNKNTDHNLKLVQMCLVDSEGNRVFKPQQLKVIKSKINGVDLMSVLMVANAINDFEKLGNIAEKYQKN